MKNVVIIGSGPAGLTCAVYCARSGLSPVIISGDTPGGQLTKTDVVENYTGFESISGVDLMMKMISHAEVVGSEIIYDKVESISKTKDGTFEIKLSGTEPLISKAIVVATGSNHRHLEVPGEAEFSNKGVSWCATCDGPMFKNKRVAVVGGGNTAVMEALFLSSFAAEVLLIHRRDSLKSDRIMQERLLGNDKIKCIWNSEIVKISGASSVQGMTIQNTIDKTQTEMPIDGIFIAIGTVPVSSIVENLVELDETGHIKTSKTKTSCPGIFAIGDVVSDSLKQAIYSAGQGALAAKYVEEYLGVR